MPDIRSTLVDIEIGRHYLEDVSAHWTVEEIDDEYEQPGGHGRTIYVPYRYAKATLLEIELGGLRLSRSQVAEAMTEARLAELERATSEDLTEELKWETE